MKINLILDNTKFTTKISKQIKVSDILRNIKNTKGSNIFEREIAYELMDENFSCLSPETLIAFKENNEITFYLVPLENFLPEVSNRKAEDIEDLIIKVTGGKTKIKGPKVQTPKKEFDFRLQLIEQMANSINSIGTLSTDNAILQNRVNEINHYSQLLRNMINNELLGSLRNVEFNSNTSVNQNQNNRAQPAPVVPDENLLRDLKEMGFPEDRCRTALIMSKNNITRATDMLINDEVDYMVEEG